MSFDDADNDPFLPASTQQRKRKATVTERLQAVAKMSRTFHTSDLPADPRNEKDAAAVSLIEHLLDTKIRPDDAKYNRELPRHLERFRRDYERMQASKIQLPTLSQLSPRTRRKMAVLPPPNEVELQAIAKIEADLQQQPVQKAYDKIADIASSTLARQHLLRGTMSLSSISDVLGPGRGEPGVAGDTFNPTFKARMPSSMNPLALDASSAAFLDRLKHDIERQKAMQSDMEQRHRELLSHGGGGGGSGGGGSGGGGHSKHAKHRGKKHAGAVAGDGKRLEPLAPAFSSTAPAAPAGTVAASSSSLGRPSRAPTVASPRDAPVAPGFYAPAPLPTDTGPKTAAEFLQQLGKKSMRSIYLGDGAKEGDGGTTAGATGKSRVSGADESIYARPSSAHRPGSATEGKPQKSKKRAASPPFRAPAAAPGPVYAVAAAVAVDGDAVPAPRPTTGAGSGSKPGTAGGARAVTPSAPATVAARPQPSPGWGGPDPSRPTSPITLTTHALGTHAPVPALEAHLQKSLTTYDLYHGESHTQYLESLCVSVEKELGLVLDAKLHRRKAQQAACRLIVYTVARERRRHAFARYKAQYQRLTAALRDRQARLIQRVVRGHLGRDLARQKRLAKRLQIQAQEDREHRAEALRRYRYSAHAICAIQETYRRARGRARRRAYAATQIQRVYRGGVDREYLRPMQAWRRWRRAVNVVVTAAAALRRARYRLRVLDKVRTRGVGEGEVQRGE